MSNITALVAYDGAATPAIHNFVATSVSRVGDVHTAMWMEKLANIPDEAQVRLKCVQTLLKSGVRKCEWEVVVPVMESILNQNASGYTAAPKVAYEDTFRFTSFAAKRSTVNSRRLARQLLVNLSGNVTTSVAASTTGAFSELFDSLIMPT